MRILHIISRMDPIGGGPQEVVRLLLRHAPEGYAQEVVTLDDPAAPFLQNETATIHVLGSFEGYGLQPVRDGSKENRGFSPGGFAAPHLTRWLRANRDRFDGIMLHGMWEYASFAVLRSIAGHKPYVVFAHGMLDPYFKRASPLKHLKKWLYWLPVQYWTLRRAHRVLFTTTAERDLATQSFWLHHWQPLVVPIGAEAPEARSIPAPGEAPPTPQETSEGPEARSIPAWGEPGSPAGAFARWGGAAPRVRPEEARGPEARPIGDARDLEAFYRRCPAVRGKRFLLFLGRIDPKKGCDLLIEAFSKTLKDDSFGPVKNSVISTDQRERRDPCILPAEARDASDPQDLHLVIAGPDSLNWGEQLRANAQTWGIADRIHLPGMLQGDAKWGAFAACEAFILPSHQENFGIAVVEALACGKPVLIAHPVNISADLAADGCALVEDDTLAGTERLLTRWLALSPEQRANMGIAARNTFATRYDMRMNAHGILRCFEGQTGHEVDPA